MCDGFVIEEGLVTSEKRLYQISQSTVVQPVSAEDIGSSDVTPTLPAAAGFDDLLSTVRSLIVDPIKRKSTYDSYGACISTLLLRRGKVTNGRMVYEGGVSRVTQGLASGGYRLDSNSL